MCSKLFFLLPIFILCSSQLTRAAYLRCYNGSLGHALITPLNEPTEIMPCINPSLPTVIYTFGYRGKSTGPATTAVITAYLNKRKNNIVLLDWEEEARSGMLGIPLGYALSAVRNAKKVGIKLGEALLDLAESGVKMNDVHLVGHSLGAHVMGFAGKLVRQNGQVVARITGLDPARALFEGVLSIQSGLDRTCAKFVDIVHTDPGGYGISTSSGTVDIWPNFGRNGGAQPGCPIGDFDMFSKEDLCSHDRSWQYFVEAIGSPTSFPCAGARNFKEWLITGGMTDRKIYLGALTSTRAKGNFYLNTNSSSLYALGEMGTKPYFQTSKGPL